MKNPFARGTLWILVRCTIGVFEWQTIGGRGLWWGLARMTKRFVW
jgi:hypothetical protein